MTTSGGVETFRDFEHAGWQNVAGGYDDHFASLTSQTIGAVLDAVGADQDVALLDIATGPGYVAAAAAERGAQVTGVDFSSVMVQMASARYPNILFCDGDAEALSFPDESFDAAVMNFGLLHLSNPERALSEACRVLRRGTRFVFTVWAPPEYSIGFALVLKAIEACGNPAVALPQGPPFFRFSNGDECARCLWSAGFRGSITTRIAMTWVLPGPEAFFNAFYTGTPRTGGILRAQAPEQLSAIKSRVFELVRQYEVDGQLRIPMAAALSTAMKI
ncbi:MAG: class I SAM-dependent methyltransferase [Candidatus Obscuribacterales bacterium]|nr:class I SAM-dependent methyltransferase [Candidatus Obscuribacterales bacterium]